MGLRLADECYVNGVKIWYKYESLYNYKSDTDCCTNNTSGGLPLLWHLARLPSFLCDTDIYIQNRPSLRMRNDKIFKSREHSFSVSFGREPSRGMNSAFNTSHMFKIYDYCHAVKFERSDLCISHFGVWVFVDVWEVEWTAIRAIRDNCQSVGLRKQGLLLPPALPTKTSSSPPSPQHTPSQTDNHKVTTPITMEHESYRLLSQMLSWLSVVRPESLRGFETQF